MTHLPPELRLLLDRFLGDLLMPEASLLPILFLMLARLIPFYYMSFFLGSRLLPMPVKVFFCLSLFIYMIPSMLTAATQLDFGILWAGYIIKEIFIGLILGMLVAIPNYIIMISGMVIDFQRGASSLVTSNLILGIQDSPLGILFSYLLIYLYWQQEVPFTYLEAIAHSYLVLPIDQWIGVEFFAFDGALYKNLRELFSLLYATGIQLAAPSLVIILMVDLFLGITNRLAPQVMISFLAQGLKALLGLTVLALGWQRILAIFGQQALLWAKQFYSWVDSAPF